MAETYEQVERERDRYRSELAASQREREQLQSIVEEMCLYEGMYSLAKKDNEQLRARVDAAENIAQDIQDGCLPNIWQYIDDMHADLQDEVGALADTVEKLVAALAPPPAAPVQAEGER